MSFAGTVRWSVCDFRLIVLFFMPLSTSFSADAPRAPIDSETKELVDGLMSPVGETASNLRNRLLTQRSRAVRASREVLRQAPGSVIGDLQRVAAIELLGEWRAPEAADALVAIATFVPRINAVTESGPLQHFPAARALVAIGEPACDAIFRRLLHPATDLELKVFAYVLSMRKGQVNRDFGLFLVEDAHQRTRAKGLDTSNFERMARILRTGDFGDASDWPSG